MRDGYSYLSTPFLKIEYVSTVIKIGEDPETEEEYKFNQYNFIVESDNGRETVFVNSDDGYYQ